MGKVLKEILLKNVFNLMCFVLKLGEKLGRNVLLCPDFTLASGIKSLIDRVRKRIARKERMNKVGLPSPSPIRLPILALIIGLSFPNYAYSQSHQAELYLDDYCQEASCLVEMESIQQYLTQLKNQCQTTVNLLLYNRNIDLLVEAGQIKSPDGEVWMDGSVDYLLLLEPASFTLYTQQDGQLTALEDGPQFAALQSDFSDLIPYPHKNYCAIRSFLSALACGTTTLPSAPCQVEPVTVDADLTFLHLDVEELEQVQEIKQRLIANHCARVVIVKLPRFSPYYKAFVENHQLPEPLVEQMHSRYGREVTLFLAIPDPQSMDYTLGIQHIRNGEPGTGECASQVQHILEWLPSLEQLRIPAAMTELEALLKGGEAYQNSQLTNLKLIFKPAPTSRYGFDFFQYPAHAGNYDQLDPEENPPYYIPWQSIKLGNTDATLARRQDGGFIPPMASFVDALGVDIPVTSSAADQRLLELPPPAAIEAPAPVYAQIPGPDGPTTVGQLNTVAYEEKLLNVVIVPVNGATANFSAVELKNSLRSIWQQAVVEVSVTMHNGINVPEFNGQLAAMPTGFLSNYTPQMRDIIRAYKDVQPPQPNVYYLFLVNDHEVASKLGYMPRKKAYGFIIKSHHNNLESYARTIGHELGHGAFVLEHTFKTYEGQLSPGSTNNLMDYSDSTHLHKYQWDLVHDPANVWSVLDADEDRDYVIVEGLEQLQEFRNDDGDGVFDADDSFTFLAPSGLPVTIPATASLVVFDTGDELGGPMGIPEYDEFELMPFGVLRFFILDGIKYNNYFFTSEHHDFSGYAKHDNVVVRYYDTLTPNFTHLASRKAIIGFPCMEEGKVYFKVGQVNLSDVLSPAEIASVESAELYQAKGPRRAYDYLAGINTQGEDIKVLYEQNPPYHPDAEHFLHIVGDAAACNSSTAMYAFAHAHQISLYPGFYRNCPENFNLLSTEGMYRYKREAVNRFLDQGNLEVYGPFGELMLAGDEIEAWRSHDESVYKTYFEKLGDKNLDHYLANIAAPYTLRAALALADYMREWVNEPCVFEALSWAQRAKIIRVLSTLTLAEDNLIDNWYLFGDEEEEENLFVVVVNTTPEIDYCKLLELFEDGDNYGLYFDVARKLQDGPNDNDPHGYENFVTFLAKVTLSASYRTLANSNFYPSIGGQQNYCAEITGQGCVEIISLYQFPPLSGCGFSYHARFMDDNRHGMSRTLTQYDCEIEGLPYFADGDFYVTGRPFDYVPVYVSENVQASLPEAQAHILQGGNIYVLPYCYADLLIRKMRSSQVEIFAAEAELVLAVALAPFTLGGSLALTVVTIGDIAFASANLFVFAPANYEMQISGNSYLSRSVLDEWQALELIWGAANITGLVTHSATGATKFTFAKGRQLYENIKSTSQTLAQFYEKTDDLIQALRGTYHLMQATGDLVGQELKTYLRAEGAAIDLTRHTNFVSPDLEYPIKVSQENFSAYYRVIDDDIQIAGGAFIGDDQFYIIPNKWAPDISLEGAIKVADLQDMPFKDLRPGGHGYGQVVTGDLEAYFKVNFGFFFRLVGDLSYINPSLLRFHDLFLNLKSWNWSKFEGEFADWVIGLNTTQRDELYKNMKHWEVGAQGENIFDNLKADLFTNTLPDDLTNAELRAFLEEDMRRVIGWEMVQYGPYYANPKAIEFFTNRDVLYSRNRVLNYGVAAQYPDIPIEELTAIYHYTASNDQSLNAALRAGNLNLFFQAFGDLLDAVLPRLTPADASILYRGVYGAEAALAKTWNVGEEIQFLDFKSSSFDQNVANGFAIDNSGDVVYEITNPVAYEISNMSFLPHEAEALFKTNSRFRVVDIETEVEIVHRGNNHRVTKIYLQFIESSLDPTELYDIFRTKFLDQGASEIAAQQLATQTDQLFQSKGWTIQEFTNELAEVLVRAEDGSATIFTRLADWETPKLNSFLEDLASEQGGALVAFFGGHTDGIVAWEKLLDGGFLEHYRRRIFELYDSDGLPQVLLKEGNPVDGEVELTFNWYGEEITEPFRIIEDLESGELRFRFRNFQEEGTVKNGRAITHHDIPATPSTGLLSTFPVNELLNMQNSVTNSGDGYYTLANAYRLYLGPGVEDANGIVGMSVQQLESFGGPLKIWKSLDPEIPGVFTADHRRPFAVRLAGLNNNVSVEWVAPQVITKKNGGHWWKMTTTDHGVNIDVVVDYLIQDDILKFCPINTPNKTRETWHAIWEDNQYHLYDQNNNPISWETIGMMIPE